MIELQRLKHHAQNCKEKHEDEYFHLKKQHLHCGYEAGVADGASDAYEDIVSKIDGILSGGDQTTPQQLASLAEKMGYRLIEKDVKNINELISEVSDAPEIKAALDEARLKLYAERCEKLGFALVPFHPTPKMLEPYIDNWSDDVKNFAISVEALRASKIYTNMIEVGRVKPQKPD